MALKNKMISFEHINPERIYKTHSYITSIILKQYPFAKTDTKDSISVHDIDISINYPNVTIVRLVDDFVRSIFLQNFWEK